MAMADNSTIIRLDIIKYNPIGIEKKMLVLPQIYYIIVAGLELMVAFLIYRKC